MSYHFSVVCTSHEGEPDFIFGKIYKAASDESEEESNLIRIRNEFGEDYLYSKQHFAVIELPEEVKQKLFEDHQVFA